MLDIIKPCAQNVPKISISFDKNIIEDFLLSCLRIPVTLKVFDRISTDYLADELARFVWFASNAKTIAEKIIIIL